MKTRNWIMVGALIAAVVLVAADGTLKTDSGDIILDPAGNDVFVDNADVHMTQGYPIKFSGEGGGVYLWGSSVELIAQRQGDGDSYLESIAGSATKTGRIIAMYGNSPLGVSGTKYVSMYHDGTNSHIDSSLGDITLNPAGNVNVKTGASPTHYVSFQKSGTAVMLKAIGGDNSIALSCDTSPCWLYVVNTTGSYDNAIYMGWIDNTGGKIATAAGDITIDPASGKVGLDGNINCLRDGCTLDLAYNGGASSLIGGFYNDFTIRNSDSNGVGDGIVMQYDTNDVGSATSFSTFLDVSTNGLTLAHASGDITLNPAGNGHVLPGGDNTDNLGKSGQKWNDIYYGGQLKTSSIGYKVPDGKSAVNIVADIETGEDGDIDHSSVDESLLSYDVDFSRRYYQELNQIMELKENNKDKSEEDIARENNFKAYLEGETQEYEVISVSKLIMAQAEAIKELQEELCAKDNSYKFC